MDRWLQIKGDPAIRKNVFLQERSPSRFDRSVDACCRVLKNLIVHHGIFHLQIHFSRSQVMLWHRQKPYEYSIHSHEGLLERGFAGQFSVMDYPAGAKIPQARLDGLFQKCRMLRLQDDVIYLRSGTINVYNGIVGLNFSCDGTHYVDYATFLESPAYAGLGAEPEGAWEETEAAIT